MIITNNSQFKNSDYAQNDKGKCSKDENGNNDSSGSNNSNLMKKLNIRAKAFTRLNLKEESSCISSICSENSSSSLNNVKKTQAIKILSPEEAKSADSEIDSKGELTNQIEENKDLLSGNNFVSEGEDNTYCTTSPIKNSEKKMSFSIKSKNFTPTYMKNMEENIQKDADFEQFDVNFCETGVNSFIEMSMYQLLNERLSVYANSTINNPYDHSEQFGNLGAIQSNTKSKSVPTNDKTCDIHKYITNLEENEFYESDENEKMIDETAFYEKLDSEICLYVSEVEVLLSSVSEERNILLNKIITDICKNAFQKYSVKVDIFGSLVTGLALETSDMDLVVTGLKIEKREDVIEYIRILTQHFEDCDYFRNIKAIEGASVPIIKLEADLQQIRENENSLNSTRVESRMRYLQIDITFDDSKEK